MTIIRRYRFCSNTSYFAAICRSVFRSVVIFALHVLIHMTPCPDLHGVQLLSSLLSAASRSFQQTRQDEGVCSIGSPAEDLAVAIADLTSGLADLADLVRWSQRQVDGRVGI